MECPQKQTQKFNKIYPELLANKQKVDISLQELREQNNQASQQAGFIGTIKNIFSFANKHNQEKESVEVAEFYEHQLESAYEKRISFVEQDLRQRENKLLNKIELLEIQKEQQELYQTDKEFNPNLYAQDLLDAKTDGLIMKMGHRAWEGFSERNPKTAIGIELGLTLPFTEVKEGLKYSVAAGKSAFKKFAASSGAKVGANKNLQTTFAYDAVKNSNLEKATNVSVNVAKATGAVKGNIEQTFGQNVVVNSRGQASKINKGRSSPISTGKLDIQNPNNNPVHKAEFVRKSNFEEIKVQQAVVANRRQAEKIKQHQDVNRSASVEAIFDTEWQPVKNNKNDSSGRKKAQKSINRKIKLLKNQGFQEHHIISNLNKKTKDHELWQLAEMDIEARLNKIFLPSTAESHPTRTVHMGRHFDRVSRKLEENMEDALNLGQINQWTQEQYARKLKKIISEERRALRTGIRALNKNHRQWSVIQTP